MAESQQIVHIIGALGEFDDSYLLRELVRSQVAAGAGVSVITLITTRESRQAIEKIGATCLTLHRRWRFDPFVARQLTQMLRQLRPDVVHFWGEPATDAALLARRAVPKARLAATLARLPRHRNRWWSYENLQALDSIAVDRPAVRAEFQQASIDVNDIVIIPPGISMPVDEHLTRTEWLSQLSLPAEGRFIAVAGNLERSQLVDEAIWNFELIRILHDQTYLVIIGDGPDSARLERFTRLVTEPGAVRFVTHPVDLLSVLAHSEVYWQPGSSESIPPAMLMAMSLGLPVVANDLPAHRVAICHGTNGFLVPTKKRAIWARHSDQLLRSPELRIQLGTAARQTIAEQFPLAAMIQAYGALYGQAKKQAAPTV